MSTTPDSYHRTEDFETRVDSVLLPDEAWAVFAQLDKPVTAADIARALGAEPTSVQKHIDLLIENKLVRKRLVNWREFLAQKGIATGPTRMSPAGPQPSPATLAVQARKAAAPQPPPAAVQEREPAPAAPLPTRTVPAAAPRATVRPPEPQPIDPDGTITFRLSNEQAHRARRASLAMCITFRLGGAPRPATSAAPAAVRIAPAAPPSTTRPAPASPPAPAPSVEREPEPEPVLVGAAVESERSSGFAPRKLRTLIDAITRKGGGGLQGQLLVYRVFLRVPPAIMFSAGIKSLSLVDDALELRDERAYDAIRTAARSVASLDLDEAAA